MCLFGDIRNSIHEKSNGIPRNFTEFYHTEFSGIPRNRRQFRTEYGIDGSKKAGGIPCRRNSVDTLDIRRAHGALMLYKNFSLGAEGTEWRGVQQYGPIYCLILFGDNARKRKQEICNIFVCFACRILRSIKTLIPDLGNHKHAGLKHLFLFLAMSY